MNPDISTNPMDYADLLNRLFIDKDQRLLRELKDFHILGPHLGHSRSIEFQKRVWTGSIAFYISTLRVAHTHTISTCVIYQTM